MSKSITLNSKSTHIYINGYSGFWYTISTAKVKIGYDDPKQVFLLEHETYGDETEHLIVDENAQLIIDDVWNGFSDLEEGLDNVIILEVDDKLCNPDTSEPMYSEDIPDTINIKDINTMIDVIRAFNILQEKAKSIGFPMCLNKHTSNPIRFTASLGSKLHNITVDTKFSDAQEYCPRCFKLLYPSDVAGYNNVCCHCDENFN